MNGYLRSKDLDLFANYLSFCLLAASAVIANIVIASSWDVATLGVFNQVVGVFIVISQLSVFGQQNAMLHQGAQLADEPDELGASIACALFLSVLASIVAALLIFVLSEPIAALLGSPDVGIGLRLIAPAMVFNAFVKVVMQTLNGIGRVRLFAVLQATRPALILVGLASAAFLKQPGYQLPFFVTLAEAGTMLVAAVLLMSACRVRAKLAHVVSRLPFMTAFGLRSFPAGLLGELNTRVDYFVLGIFASDTIVGVYSFAAAFAEGFFMAIVVVRVVVTPRLARVLKSKDESALMSFISSWKWRAGLAGASLLVISTLVYGMGLIFLLGASPLKDSMLYYCILALGVALASPYIPFGNILLLEGRPGIHSLYYCGLVLLNLAGNFALTPPFGATGTAAATALTYVASASWLAIICRRALGLRL